jgi:pimeloyl-ACP methyl ester carboxylesterase
LVHGFAQNHLAYTSGGLPAALLARGARVFIGELRGHGLSRFASPSATPDWNLQTLLEYDLPTLVHGVCEASHQDRVHLVGHSMGGILGYGMLSRSHRLASLTALAAPLTLGDGKPVLRTAAKLASPILKLLLPNEVPTDRLLRRISKRVSTEPRRGVRGRLNDLWRLANPNAADYSKILQVLQNADPSSKALLLDLVNIARGGPAVIGRIDLVTSANNSRLPVAAVVAEKDIFAGPKSVRALSRGCGPRRIVVLPRAGHVDLTMGAHCDYIVDQLWSFLTKTA